MSSFINRKREKRRYLIRHDTRNGWTEREPRTHSVQSIESETCLFLAFISIFPSGRKISEKSQIVFFFFGRCNNVVSLSGVGVEVDEIAIFLLRNSPFKFKLHPSAAFTFTLTRYAIKIVA
jgi:hypothetical protein